LVVGDVFGQASEADDELQSLLNGSISIPLPTYFTLGDNALPAKVVEKLESSDEICPNLIYLGRKGTFTTSEGIRIVSLGGRLVQDNASVTKGLGKFDPLYLESEAKALHGAHSAHILLTNQWPASIARLSSIDVPKSLDKDSGTHAIANLCLALKPSYHFSSSPSASWEREPFRQPDEYGSLQEAIVTRFNSKASIGASNKDWMSAFTVNTSQPPPAAQTTEAPFFRGSPNGKRPHDVTGGYSRYGDDYGDRRRHKRPRNTDPSDCFMCLNKPGFKAHMVASIGDESLVTVLRGPLPLPSTFPELSSSGHVMIIPHYHAADELAQGRRSQEEVASEFAEMTKFRRALSKMIGEKSEGKLGTVCWEVNRTGIRHFHWQLIAAQAEQIRKGLIEAAFKVLAEKRKHQPFEDCDPSKQLEQRSDYFRVWTWTPSANPVEQANEQADGGEDPGSTKSIFFPLPASERGFYIWFGREVMAGILQLEDRVNWQSALHPDENEELKIEERDTAGLKDDFADFDFAMQ
jgi:Protein similar to CwfJ C-terminus 1/Protein similar to CwfJ C-terminus 2